MDDFIFYKYPKNWSRHPWLMKTSISFYSCLIITMNEFYSLFNPFIPYWHFAIKYIYFGRGESAALLSGGQQVRSGRSSPSPDPSPSRSGAGARGCAPLPPSPWILKKKKRYIFWKIQTILFIFYVYPHISFYYSIFLLTVSASMG